jgi:mannose-1-phosphate guanylyltransferase/mannose-6-phosphate isomerase
MSAPLYAVVLAGGRGTRFWPRSRRALPKQFLRLTGRRSLLAETFARVGGLAPPSRVLVVTTRELGRAVRRDLPRVPAANVLLEPAGRNTAPAIALAAHRALARAKDALLLVLPSDHFVGDAEGFRDAVRAGAAFLEAEPSALVVFGVAPTRPETGYGYIRVGGATAHARVRRVAEFIEKPDLEHAQRLIAEGGVHWNAGVFLWRAEAFLRALAEHAPEIAEGAARVAKGGSLASASAKRAYARIPALSADVAVLEKSANVHVVPIDIRWSDLGSWVSLAEALERDADGNVVVGNHVGVDTRGSIILGANPEAGKKRKGKGRLIATIGVENVIVVETDDALLVCRRDRAQDVRELVRRLEARGFRHLT